jgi:hypothetical protein
MFLIPTFMLFVFLIYETAKLSRVKIRHQFAVDAAAFVEMTNYSDFLNRSAYVNGAFPMRIFWEGFHDTKMDCMGRDPCPAPPISTAPAPLSEILFADGAYPRSTQVSADGSADAFKDVAASLPSWQIRFGGIRSYMNDPEPSVNSSNSNCSGKCVEIITMNTAKYWNINWEDATQVYKLYVQIYQLLGSVESAQFSVLKRLAGQHNFLKKSYWLNTGGDGALAEAEALVQSLNKADTSSGGSFENAVKIECTQKVYFHGNQLVHSWAQPYQTWASQPPPGESSPIGNISSDCNGGGDLFQVVWVKQSKLDSLAAPTGDGSRGWPVMTSYTVGDNYFKVGLDSLMRNDTKSGCENGGPCVRATVSVAGFGASPSVWPNPTPKYQVRLYP